MLFIAHRGESYDAPENTLAAINLAWERDADAVEVDVHLSRDGKIVVIHDNNTWKFNEKNKRVRDQTFEELQQIDIGKLKGGFKEAFGSKNQEMAVGARVYWDYIRQEMSEGKRAY